MITNPYKVLGVPDGASLEECTKAYKKLAKKYHPDINPDASAASKMAEINSAFDQIKNAPAAGAASGESSAGAPDYYSAIERFINNRQYDQALNLLGRIEDRPARWYYLSAVANYGSGNKSIANSHINIACSREPGNWVYTETRRRIEAGSASRNPFESFETDYDYDEPRSTTVFTHHRGGCLGRIIRFIFIVAIIRLVIYVALSFSTHRSRYYGAHSAQPGSSYSQQQDSSEESTQGTIPDFEYNSGGSETL